MVRPVAGCLDWGMLKSRARIVASLLASITALLLAPSGASAAFGYLGSIGANAWGIGTDLQGNLYVAADGSHSIARFTPTGAALPSLGGGGSGPGQFKTPLDVEVTASGQIFVADGDNSRIQRLSASGAYETEWAAGDATRANQPMHVASDGDGNVYVVLQNGNRVTKYDPNGKSLRGFGGKTGDGDGQVSGIGGVDVDAAGNVYVADGGNHRVLKFNADGQFVSTWGVGVAGGSGWQVCTSNCVAGDQAEIFNPDFDSSPSRPFNVPNDVAVTPDGRVIVADRTLVRVFTSTGALQGGIGSVGGGTGQYSRPSAVAVDCRGRVYVADTWKDGRILRYGDPDAAGFPCEGPSPVDPGIPSDESDPGQVGTGKPKQDKDEGSDSDLMVTNVAPALVNGKFVYITVVVPGPGKVTTSQAGGAAPSTASASAKKRAKKRDKKAGKRSKKVLLVTRKKVKKAGPVKVAARLNRRGKKMVKRKGRLVVRVRIAFKPTGGKATSRVKRIAFKKTAPKKRSRGKGRRGGAEKRKRR